MVTERGAVHSAFGVADASPRSPGSPKRARIWARTMAEPTNVARELVGYRRSSALPGVEVIDATDSPREWRVICSGYAIVVYRTWRGRIRTRGRVLSAEPGVAFCNSPGELMVANPEGGPGSFNVLQLETGVLTEWLAEQQRSSVRLEWSAIVQPISSDLSSHFWHFFERFEPATSAMHVQSQALELSAAMIGELVATARGVAPIATTHALRGAARMRECLNEEGQSIDLDTLANRAGLSRFQALRAFKQRYGLPPHAYQLCLRMDQARRLLVEGIPAVEVALRCGFVDQSHFNRHFKRFNAVTPMQYARAHSPTRKNHALLEQCAAADDRLSVVSRADQR